MKIIVRGCPINKVTVVGWQQTLYTNHTIVEPVNVLYLYRTDDKQPTRYTNTHTPTAYIKPIT